ncbi:hypothetical protein GUITHDRAFT_100457 [Guillardia theta CCMP2712]|uniref:PH domain-containing protein n=1 Tax=Guillardia theta (strain CCMP2712) TaxID=905079 RepID=L1K0X5_GUITC|nr:hypothetical protein GUITHDRAFT_100457 [Guillardia theta CCMP2712]EKX54209.1 hypothetical protein GUITHDRAFT_100457 [Guillardia theta CCMP2712]|eukprot:XP_005841189.1 hypothetical protein GUITHDRAFT_100457 [Guillardia theta CCMP2712]
MSAVMLHAEYLYSYVTVPDGDDKVQYSPPPGEDCDRISSDPSDFKLEYPTTAEASDSTGVLPTNRCPPAPGSVSQLSACELDLMRLQLQAAFLSYRSPDTTPKQYISHEELIETFKDLSAPAAGHHKERAGSCSSSRPQRIQRESEGKQPSRRLSARSDCEGVYGVVEMRTKKGAQRPEKVKCTIESGRGRMLLSIFGGNDYKVQMGFVYLEESYVASYPSKPPTFAVGLMAGNVCVDDSEVLFSCHTISSRDKWVEALLQGGCRVKSKREQAGK